MSLWNALSDLGIEASTSITRIDDDDQFNNTRSFHQTSCIHHPIQTPKNPNELYVGSSSMSKQLTLGVGGVDERAQMTSMAGSTRKEIYDLGDTRTYKFQNKRFFIPF